MYVKTNLRYYHKFGQIHTDKTAASVDFPNMGSWPTVGWLIAQKDNLCYSL